MSMSSSSSLSSQYHVFDPFVIVRGDSPLLGFDNDCSDDPLHFPAPDYSRPLPCETFPKCERPLPLPPAVVPGLQKRASAMSLRKRTSTFLRSRACSSAGRSMHSLAATASSDSVRRAVYIESDPDDSGSDFAHRLGVLLSAPADASLSRLNFSVGTPSDLSSPSSPSSRSSLRLAFPSSHISSEEHTPETSPDVPSKCYPYLLPPPPDETSRWSLSSATDVPEPASAALPRSIEHILPSKSPNRKSIIRFGTKRSFPEARSPIPQGAPPKETKRKRLASLISRLSLAPRSSVPVFTLASIPPVTVRSPQSSTPPSSSFSHPLLTPQTPDTAPYATFSCDQESTVPVNNTQSHSRQQTHKPILRSSRSEYLLRRDPDLHSKNRRPWQPTQLDQPHMRRHCEEDDQEAKYPSLLTLPHTQYLPFSNCRPTSFARDSTTLAPGYFSIDYEEEDEQIPPPPPKDDWEQGAALLGLVFSKERYGQGQGAGVAF